jgi:hypothetical protein
MPTQWTFDLALTTELADEYRYNVLHALACAFFEQADSDHESESKPFVVRLAGPTPNGSRLTLTWLPDDPPPAAVIPAKLRLGPHHVEVTALHMHTIPLAGLGAGASASRVRYSTLSPTKFRHHGRDYPLPDPYLIYTTLLRRYRALHPHTGEHHPAPELPRNVVIYQHDIRTQHFTWHGRRSAGFVGTVTFGLLHTCSDHDRRLFTALNHLAAIAGIGHGTTHGLGAVDTEHLPTPRRQSHDASTSCAAGRHPMQGAVAAP